MRNKPNITEDKFTKDNLHNEGGGYLTFCDGDNRYHFVARFKYSGGPITRATFRTELIKNWKPSEYFAAMEQDGLGGAPLQILKGKNPYWYADRVAKWTARQEAKAAKRNRFVVPRNVTLVHA